MVTVFPDAEQHLYLNAGHYVLEDAKREIIKDIHDFLSEGSARNSVNLGDSLHSFFSILVFAFFVNYF